MTKIIKRYSNRKLYDTEQSTYVTLDEIEQMVKAGEELRIIDNATKDDITHITLAHIIFEQEKAQKSGLPVSALRGIIQSGEEFIGKLQTPVQQFKDEFRKKAEVVGESGKAVREFVDSTQRSIDELQRRMDARMRDAFDQLTHIPELRDDVTYLNDRIARLEASLHRMERSMAESKAAARASVSDPKRDLPSSFDEP